MAMKMAEREPALVAGGVAALVSAAVALVVAMGWLDPTRASALEAFGLAMLAVGPAVAQAWWTRRKVMPVDTIRDAGQSPATIKRQAVNPNVRRCER